LQVLQALHGLQGLPLLRVSSAETCNTHIRKNKIQDTLPPPPPPKKLKKKIARERCGVSALQRNHFLSRALFELVVLVESHLYVKQYEDTYKAV
jgi:hypothetical protein